jgi:hypothetical protein
MSFVPPAAEPITWLGFLTFLQNVVGVPSADLPPSGVSVVTDSSGAQVIDSSGNPVTSNPSDYPPQVWALVIALQTVNGVICIASQYLYNQAVYMLATDLLIQFGQDQPNQTWFAQQRKLYKIDAFAPGVVSSGGDGGSSASLEVPQQMKNFTMGDLQNMKTKWGRRYLAIASDFGGQLFGVS